MEFTFQDEFGTWKHWLKSYQQAQRFARRYGMTVLGVN